MPDLAALTTIPLSAVVEIALREPVFRLRFTAGDEKALSQINAYSPELRTLFWLNFFRHVVPLGGMHLFFTLNAQTNDPDIADECFAPQVFAALTDAGMVRRAVAFGAAQSLAMTNIDADFSALDANFGTAEDLATEIEDYVRRMPVLAGWADKARVNLSDDERLGWLTSQFFAMSATQWDRLPTPLHQIFLLEYFNAEMLNGSVHQFFFNSSGDYAPKVVEAMRAVDLTKHAAAVQRGIDMFDAPTLPTQENGGSNILAMSGTRGMTDWPTSLKTSMAAGSMRRRSL